MGKMIDTDVLINILSKNNIFNLVRNAEDKNVYQIIDDIPDAINVDMILEQLKDYGKYKGDLHITDNGLENCIPVNMAITIVKAGGYGGVLGYMKE